MNTKLIAPCGMNCGICIAYLRDKNRCPGCRETNKNTPDYCKRCVIRNCITLKKNHWKFCSGKCKKYPCARLKNLDRRYTKKYNMSMIENLENIKKSGIRKFTKDEKIRWTCSRCGGTICVHKGYCYICKKKKS